MDICSPGRGFVDGIFIDKSGILGSDWYGSGKTGASPWHEGSFIIEGNEDRTVLSDA